MVLTQLEFTCVPTDVAFHPSIRDKILVGLVDGGLQMLRTGTGEKKAKILFLERRLMEDGSIRSSRFSADGDNAVCGGSDGTLKVIDLRTRDIRNSEKPRKSQTSGEMIGISCLTLAGDDRNLVAVGEDEGMLRLYDQRMSQYVLKRRAHSDYVTAIEGDPGSMHTLFSSGADGCVAMWDLREGHSNGPGDRDRSAHSGSLQPNGAPPKTELDLKVRSTPVQDELLSMSVIKGGRRVVCGGSQGELSIFKSSKLDNYVDRVTELNGSLDALMKVDEDRVLVGGMDGDIQMVQIGPNAMLGFAGKHNELPIERLAVSCDMSTAASCSHDEVVKFHDLALVGSSRQDNADEDSDEPDEVPARQPKLAKPSKRRRRDGAAASADFFSGL